MPAAPVKPEHARAHPGFVRRRPRFNITIGVFVVLLGALIAIGMPGARALLLAFDTAAIAFLVLVAHMFAGADAAQIRSRAQREDQGRWGALWSGVMLSAVVLVALGLELRVGASGGVSGIVLAAGTLVLCWLFMNTMFAVHYAHAFYGDATGRQTRGGLEFPGTDDPDYWDFAYFALVIGMTFQVSDVQISARPLRHAALAHAVIAFFFNVVIIAISVNVAAGQH